MQISAHNLLLAAQQAATAPKAAGPSFAAALKELPAQPAHVREAAPDAMQVAARPMRPGATLDIKV